jgi:hypothetical protein
MSTALDAPGPGMPDAHHPFADCTGRAIPKRLGHGRLGDFLARALSYDDVNSPDQTP